MSLIPLKADIRQPECYVRTRLSRDLAFGSEVPRSNPADAVRHSLDNLREV
jgi:hypothetical protein